MRLCGNVQHALVEWQPNYFSPFTFHFHSFDFFWFLFRSLCTHRALYVTWTCLVINVISVNHNTHGGTRVGQTVHSLFNVMLISISAKDITSQSNSCRITVIHFRQQDTAECIAASVIFFNKLSLLCIQACQVYSPNKDQKLVMQVLQGYWVRKPYRARCVIVSLNKSTLPGSRP